MTRVGPALYYNRIVDNSVNGLLVKIRTASGSQLESMTIPGRFDDTDIVHFLPENLVVQGTAGGALLTNEAPASTAVVGAATVGGTLADGFYNYKFTRVVNGVESLASEATVSTLINSFFAPTARAIRLTNLPVGITRIYRSTANGTGPYVQVPFTPNTTTFIDNGNTLANTLVEAPLHAARMDGRLAIDEGTVVKVQGSRIEASMGGQLIAEGSIGNPIVFTSYLDNRHGAGGTFNTTSTRSTTVSPGDWGGIYVGHTSSASLDHAIIAYGGGTTRIEGGFADFSAVEVHQGDLRLANSILEHNANGANAASSADRAGRGSNSSTTVFIRGAQPIVTTTSFRITKAAQSVPMSMH